MSLSPELEGKGTRLTEGEITAQQGRGTGNLGETCHEFLCPPSSHNPTCTVASTDPGARLPGLCPGFATYEQSDLK